MKNLLYLSLLILASFSFSGCSYNSMVGLDEEVKGQWAQVENAYQRRADLIPNLVNTVKGAAEFEKSTLEAVIKARASATSVNVNVDDLDESSMARFQEAQKGLSGALSRLLVAVERYPELKANANFRDLQAQLEGTENRITVERQKFNEVVKGYNSFVRSFPNLLYAKFLGFPKRAYFEGREGTEVAPEVKF